MKIHALRPDVQKINNKKESKMSPIIIKARMPLSETGGMITRHMWSELVRKGDGEAEMFVGGEAI